MFIEMLLGTLRDPILWIAAFLIAWPLERPFARTLQFLAAAGLALAAFRMLIYVVLFKESLGIPDAFTILVCALGLMITVGAAISVARRLIAGQKS